MKSFYRLLAIILIAFEVSHSHYTDILSLKNNHVYAETQDDTPIPIPIIYPYCC